MLGKKQLGTASNDQVTDLVRRLSIIEAQLPSVQARLKQFDYDLQDAVDGFYRRRKSDQMRDVREEEAAKRPRKLSDQELVLRALGKSGED